MKIKVLLAALLVGIVPTASLLASCAKDDVQNVNGDDAETENNEDNENSGEEIDKLSLDFSPNVPQDIDLSGRTFNVLTGSVGKYGLYAEEENSDLVNDTVYRRNKLIEDHYGVTINIVNTNANSTTGQKEAAQQFRSLIEANDDTYHAFTHVQHTGMPQMILENYFVDWNTIPHINLDEDWWYQNIKNDLCFGNKIYVMTGDYNLYVRDIDCLLFNKEIFDELELEYPYQAVKDGTWTFDMFADLVKKGARDLNGDGLMTMSDDQWGLMGWTYELSYALLVATGYAPLEKDAENMPVLNQNVDQCHEMYDKVVNFFVDGQSAWAEKSDYSAQVKAFTEGRTMFKDSFVSVITSYSDVEFDFGILPYPKYDENSEYQNRSTNMSALTYIPVTNPDLELTGAILEELAFQSAKELTPTYFDIVLTVKNTRDVESEEMLPIIRDTARFLYTGYQPSILGMIENKSNTYASSYASSLSSYQEDLEEMRALLLDQ